jgi:UDP-N-acetylmuramoylalanine--D-glutamate ligase
VEVNKTASAQPAELAALLDNWSPPFSVILNITPNHLDRHPSMKHYVHAKRAAVDYQDEQGVIVMNLDNDMTRTIGSQFGSRTRWFSLEAQMPGGASFVNSELVLLDKHGGGQRLASQAEVRLRGRHNLSNILAACLLAREVGVSHDAMRRVITTFAGVEHRLEWVREHRQVNYYNDSIATSPERLIAALNSFCEPVVLLAGGRDKHLPWQEAARLIIQKTHDVILFGEATEIIAGAVNKMRSDVTGTDTFLHRCVNLEEAVYLAAQVAQPGDVVLLAPGCASFDQFQDFAKRGERFKEVVLNLDS